VGNPYSAEAITETVQTLPDGNRISRKSAAMTYRDGEGRQRREIAVNVANNGIRSVIIVDPVARFTWSLNQANRSALKAVMPALPTATSLSQSPPTRGPSIGVAFSSSTSEIKDRGLDHGVWVNGAIPGSPAEKSGLQHGDIILTFNGQPVKDGADLMGRFSATQIGTQVTIGLNRNGKPLDVKVTTGDRPDVYKNEGPATLGVFTGPVLQSLIATGLTNVQIGKSKIEDLGPSSVEGVNVRGTRITLTVAPGEVGNERPFDIVNEVWYSADLEAIVTSKHSDPRSGDVSYRLTGINRSEPPASLFKVPADYTVTQTAAPVSMIRTSP